MKAVVQRVIEASVSVDGVTIGEIGFGLLVYLGVAQDDTENDAHWLVDKVINLRIFDDSDGKMNLSLLDIVNSKENSVNNNFVNHEDKIVNQEAVKHEVCTVNNSSVGVLAVSQFTLLGDARKGRRPSWGKAAPPEKARELYDYFIAKIRKSGLPCESGEFQAIMQVKYINDGPVTILLDSKEK